MPAQTGDTILLQYGQQGAQQNGAAIVLSFAAAPAAQRRIIAGARAPWSASADIITPIDAPHEAAIIMDTGRGAPWGQGADLDATDAAPWGFAARRDADRGSPWVDFGAPLQPFDVAPWGVSAARDDEAAAPWGRFERTLQPIEFVPWGASAKRDKERLAPWLGPMLARVIGFDAEFPASKPADNVERAPWLFFSRPLNPGWGIPTPPNPLPEPGDPVIIPVRRFYIVQNETLLIRVSDSAAIPALRMSLRLDVDSWAWGFSATIPGDALPLVEPVGGQPVELEAVVNGVQFRVLAERLTRDRSFGRADIAITGRGAAALLDAPYAPTVVFSNTNARTAQQLADEALTVNGVPLGWAVDWQLENWTVPAGVWNHQGSYMNALVRIAGAAGGYIRPDPLLRSLSFLHRYPTMPDTWAGITTPDYTLPASLSEREGIEWQDLPDYDAVYVSGVRDGVLGYVKKAGTLGATHAQMATDALITQAAAARQRGRAILGNTGRKAMITLRVPVLEAMGVIEPGKFVRFVDGGVTRTGIVRSTQVDVGRPDVWQTIGLETQVGG